MLNTKKRKIEEALQSAEINVQTILSTSAATILPAEAEADSTIEYVVLDFETTGVDSNLHRVIEVGAVIINGNGNILKSFSSLCKPDVDNNHVPEFITELTGISNSMLEEQPSTALTIQRLFHFVGERTIIAHNAPFDAKFFRAECNRIGLTVQNRFLCSLSLARRLLPLAPSHKLSELKLYIGFQGKGMQSHRAMSDVLVTVHLFNYIQTRLTARLGEMDPYRMHNLLHNLIGLTKKNVDIFIDEQKNR